METAICEQCGARQRREWRPGELCLECGGAVRAEQRCAGCSRWTPRAKFCRHCGAELLPPELYPVARTLLAAGVDRFSLAARTLALDPGQRDTLSAQYAAQAARAAWLVEEVRFCERSLLQRGWWERLDDDLAAALPTSSADAVGRMPPPAGLDLEEIFLSSTLHGTRALAAIALLREGKARRPVIELASHAVDGSDSKLEVEAALALSSWRVWSLVHPDWRELRRRSEVASKALADARLRPWAAIAVALPLWRGRGAVDQEHREKLEALQDPLREALAAPGADLRFDAALALGDEAGLEAALESGDPERRELARWRLATVQGRRVPRLLREVAEEELRDVMRGLDPPFPFAVSEALLERALRSGEQVRRDALGMLRRAGYWDLALEDRIALGQAIAREAERLRAPELLEFLSWATTPRVQEYRAPTELLPEARPIQVAATAALARAPAEERKAILRDADFDRWVVHAAPDDGLALDGWWEEPELYEALLSAHSRQNDYDRPLNPHALDLLMGLWDRSARKGELAPLLGPALGHNQGVTHRDDITAALWRRFRERPEERASLMVAAGSWKQNLYEVRDAEPPERSLDGGNPVAFFRLYASVDPNARAVLSDALEKRGGEGRLLELVDAVFDLADAEVARRPFDMMLVVAPLSSAVGNAYNSSRRTEGHAAAAVRFQERWARFAKAMEAMGYGP
ncbi:MAG TPA: zinc ribbon domain-containing protein, partial [Myxococcaceae bacterium]|nr:zinc ribbon domain-containing protein [Myxococcaceae bacterium]